MAIKYLVFPNEQNANMNENEFCGALSECGELGSGLIDTIEEARIEAARTQVSTIFEVEIKFKKVE